MKIAINGLGRIGRHVLKIGLEKGLDIVAINDLTDVETLAYLIKYDSVYRGYNKNVIVGKDFIKIGNKKISVFSEKDPANLRWKELGVDVVIESTGLFTDRNGASKHLDAGAKRVVISAPAKNPDITLVLGVNDSELKKSHKLISMASCTTNCLAPVAKVLDDSFGIKKGLMTTIHAYTSTQAVLDTPSKKIRRGRAAAQNIIPTTTGAAKAVIEVIPKLKGKIDGMAMRVPVPSGSIVDFVVELNKKASVEQVNNAMKKASQGKMKGILKYTEEEIVSSDVLGDSHSSVFDAKSIQSIGGNMFKVLSWYDNEYGYSSRLVDLVKKLK